MSGAPWNWRVVFVNPSEIAAHIVGSVKHELHDIECNLRNLVSWHLEERDAGSMVALRAFRAERLNGLCA